MQHAVLICRPIHYDVKMVASIDSVIFVINLQRKYRVRWTARSYMFLNTVEISNEKYVKI
jgi:hypothetical protein